MLRACPRALCSVSRGAPRHAPLTPLAAPRFFHINSARSKPEGGLVTKMYNKVFAGGLPKSKLKASGYILETHCSQAVDLRAFLAELEMPDTFYSWFLVTELHIWLLGARLMAEGDMGRMVRNNIVEALWVDCDNRAKAIGDLASSVRSNYIMEMAEQFQASLFVYDEGLLGNDIQLANAIWRRFFLSLKEESEEQVPDPEKLELLVSYVRRTAHHLNQLDGVDIIVKNNVKWLKLVE